MQEWKRLNNTISLEYWYADNLISEVCKELFENNNSYVQRIGDLHSCKLVVVSFVCLSRGEMWSNLLEN